MNHKIIIAAFISLITSTSFSMDVNKQAVGDKGTAFVKTIDDQVGGYVRALRRGSQVEFDALSLAMFMNQTANIEKKLDILINETRKNNRLLAMQMKSSNKLIEIINKASELTKPAQGKGE